MELTKEQTKALWNVIAYATDHLTLEDEPLLHELSTIIEKEMLSYV